MTEDLTSAPIAGLRDDDHVRGSPDAPLIFFYGDFACPRCALAHVRLGARTCASRSATWR